MLELDADKRITAEQTLAHPYLAQVPTLFRYSNMFMLKISLYIPVKEFFEKNIILSGYQIDKAL